MLENLPECQNVRMSECQVRMHAYVQETENLGLRTWDLRLGTRAVVETRESTDGEITLTSTVE